MDHQPELPLTEDDQADLNVLLGVDDPTDTEKKDPFNPVLKIWKEVLAPAESLRNEKVTPLYANRIIGSYIGITFPDMPKVQESYFDRLEVMRQILLAEIDTDDQCLTYDSVEDDLVYNGGHYKNLVFEWQAQILRWEREWLCTDEDAAVQLATIGEISKMFFGDMGLLQHLSTIGYQFTDSDQEELVNFLEAVKEGKD